MAERNGLAGVSWITLILGVALAVSPWVLTFPAGEATMTAVMGGVLIALLSLGAITTHRTWSGWFNFLLLNLVLGAIAFLAPIVLRFDAGAANAITTYVVIGLAVTILSAVQMWRYTA